MKKLLGYFLISIPFVAIFIKASYDMGIMTAVWVFLSVAISVIAIGVGVALI